MEGIHETKHQGISRRTLCFGIGGAAALMALGGTSALPAQAQVRPPGGQDEDKLISACIRCERCIEACPQKAIKPAHIEDGILGVRTPVANFNEGFCTFCKEENAGRPLCVAWCPTGALSLENTINPETTILGKAHINKDWCLAWDKNNGCKFCFDACSYEAIELDEYGRPYVIDDICNGCGACQTSCVSLKEGSIAIGATARAIIIVPEKA